MHETCKQPHSSLEIESIMDKEGDVKVCDICGDAGQEDLLAICSSCIDGAEHTYCMQTMLDKLPTGDWLCEGCKFKEEHKNQREFDTVTKIQEESFLSGGAQNTSSTVHSEIILKKDGAVINLKDIVVCRRPQILEVYDVNIDLNIRNCASPSIESPVPTETSISREVLLLSPDDSLMHRDSSTLKQSVTEQSSGSWSLFEGQKAHMTPDSISSAGRDGSKVVRGPLLKLSSFKDACAKPKIKQLLEAVPLVENTSVKNASKPARKGGLTGEMFKFASLKTEKRGCNSFELDGEKLSTRITQIEDLSVEKDNKLCVIERRNSSKDFSGSRIYRGLVDNDDSGYKCENPLHSSISSASASSNGLNLEYQNRCQVLQGFHSDEDITNKYHKPAYKPLNPNPISQHENHQNLELSHQNDIIKVVASSTTLDKPIYSGDRTFYCQKCNVGSHPTHLCSIDNHVSAIKLSVDRMSTLNASETNKWKAVRETIVSKQEGLPHCSRKNDAPSSLVFDKCEPIVHPHEIHDQAGAGRLNPFGNISKEFDMKASEHIFPSMEPFLPNVPKASVIPKLEFFWQGGFEVMKPGRLPMHCDGLQAHFSSYASGKVFEAAKNFPPNKVQLEEVPCLSSWPQHFHGNHAKEHNIALFFFAKDIESYRSSYCKLLDNMLKYDLALKGNFGGFELLIFPSYKLSENSQRWNRLLFLWGIFKGRRSSSIEMLSNIQVDPCNSTSDDKSLVKDLPTNLPK